MGTLIAKKGNKTERTELRLPVSLKRHLIAAASKNKLSLNEFCIQLLSLDKVQKFDADREARCEIMNLYQSMADNLNELVKFSIKSGNGATVDQLKYYLLAADDYADKILSAIKERSDNNADSKVCK